MKTTNRDPNEPFDKAVCMKKEAHNPFDSDTNRSYKKRYIQRKIEEQEAEEEIVFYKDKKREEHPDIPKEEE